MTFAPELGPDAFSSIHHRLQAGIEPLDPMTNGRAAGLFEIAFDVPALKSLPQLPPERRPDGLASYTQPLDSLVRFGRHESGRYSVIDTPLRPTPLRVRLGDGTRRFVPRRLAVAFTSTPVIFRPMMFPGAAYSAPPRATGVRGTLTYSAGGQPVRWARVESVDGTGVSNGFAHADDRGEFLLLLETPKVQSQLNPTLTINLKVHSRPAPLVAGTPDELAAELTDAFWDLPVEAIASPTDAAINGRAVLPELSTVTAVNGLSLKLTELKSLSIPV